MSMEKVGFGGGCHWCTEGVFRSLLGVSQVEQGWIASEAPNDSFSEAVCVHFDPAVISLHELIEIHLHTHSSTSSHSMRNKYRSAIYVFSDIQAKACTSILHSLQSGFKEELVTRVLPFVAFKGNDENFLDYFYSDPDKAFCKQYIHPKLELLFSKFRENLNMRAEEWGLGLRE